MTVDPAGDDLIVPVVEEQATVSKTLVETGRVQVSTRLEEKASLVREALRHEDVVVERVPIGETVETAPSIRQEGDTFIYPIVEEVLFVQKRLILKEEIRIRYVVRTENVEREISLRSMHADIARSDKT